MNPGEILAITREGLVVVLWVALPVVLVSTVVALVVAVLQAVTQIQDQSIGQSVRLVAVLLTLVIGSGLMGREVLRFAEQVFHAVGRLP